MPQVQHCKIINQRADYRRLLWKILKPQSVLKPNKAQKLSLCGHKD